MHALYKVPSRLKDTLPTHIQGKADYHEYANHPESNSYVRRVGDYDLDLEFINRTWYIITWNKDEARYFVNPAQDILQNPHSHGLGTLDRPAPESVSASPIQYHPPAYREPEGISSEPEQEKNPADSPVTTSSEGKTPVKPKETADSPVATSSKEDAEKPKVKGYTKEELEDLQRSFARATLGPADMSGTATIATTITGT